MFTNLQEKFGFSRNEILVLLLLCLSLFIGLGLKYHRQNTAAADQVLFDYTSVEREFHERLRADSTRAVTNDDRRAVMKERKPLPSRVIDINTATKEELLLLPGIGESYADRIIIYREDHGSFRSVDDLVEVKGIGKKMLEKLRPYVTVDGSKKKLRP